MEIEDIQDIKKLVDSFYAKVREDRLLAPIFNAKIGENWPAHLEKMYRFWQTVLLQEHTYYGSPFAPHADLPIEQAHFARWKKLFEETLNENFTGEKAEEANRRAEKMAILFLSKIDYYKAHKSKPIL
ncbi:group III truncated hemoglobin [Marinilongibacter aquaticus]|uniref:group III truncated hemoglobin n=1 Tax=Marinilongibacter aquaticus TaxID=2975157 RepID=UPI0021BD2580|nr:group III truncated hemoglobin [Marinilongibacter aquaticus]UBM59358.1 group III truncated hemoglobin [Marinilongibacter aquaticus]